MGRRMFQVRKQVERDPKVRKTGANRPERSLGRWRTETFAE